MKSTLIRNCKPNDYSSIVNIYNYYVENSVATFDTHPYTLAERLAWFDQFTDSGPYQLLVAVSDGTVTGYCYSTKYRNRPAYDVTVETTVYTDPDWAGKGQGSLLYQGLFGRLINTGVHSAVAGIALPNEASVRLHRKLGFQLIGNFPEVGLKQGRLIDVAWYSKKF